MIDVYYERGISYINREIYQKAIPDFEHFIEENPDHALAYYYLGIAHQYLSEYEQAILNLDRAIELDPEYADSYYYRGLHMNRWMISSLLF